MELTRRDAFALIAGAGLFVSGGRLAFGASDFWNKKGKDEWSRDEIRTLSTKSPWAKEVRIEYRRDLAPNFDGTPDGLAMPAGAGGSGIPQGQQSGSRMNIPLGGNAGDAGTNARGGNRGIPFEATAATVRWESAQPILDALKSAVPEDFEDRYVIAVVGLPVRTDVRAVPDLILKNSAFLQAKGKEPAQPGVVRYSKEGSTILFGFSKEFLPLTAADKDVQFSLNTGDIEVRARFEPKEMMYRGQLAI